MTAKQKKSAEYAMHLSLQGGQHLQVILERLLGEMGELRDGPGEEEMERLAPALAPLFGQLLQATGGAADVTLTCDLRGDATQFILDLKLVPVAGAAAPPDDLLDPLLPALRQAFDKVETPAPQAGEALHVVLTRGPIR